MQRKIYDCIQLFIEKNQKESEESSSEESPSEENKMLSDELDESSQIEKVES